MLNNKKKSKVRVRFFQNVSNLERDPRKISFDFCAAISDKRFPFLKQTLAKYFATTFLQFFKFFFDLSHLMSNFEAR